MIKWCDSYKQMRLLVEIDVGHFLWTIRVTRMIKYGHYMTKGAVILMNELCYSYELMGSFYEWMGLLVCIYEVINQFTLMNEWGQLHSFLTFLLTWKFWVKVGCWIWWECCYRCKLNKLKFLVKSYVVKCGTRIIKPHESTSITKMQRVQNN